MINVDLFSGRSATISNTTPVTGTKRYLEDGQELGVVSFEHYVASGTPGIKAQLRFYDGINWLAWNDLVLSDGVTITETIGTQEFISYNIPHQMFILPGMSGYQVRLISDPWTVTINIINAVGVVLEG